MLDSHLDIVRQLVTIDSTRIASGSDDGSIIVWQSALGQLLHRFEGHTHGVTALLLLSDGETLASGASDRSVRLWSVRTYQHLRTLSVHTASVTCLERLSGPAARFVSGGNDRKIHVWQNDGTSLGVIERQEEENLHCLLYVGNELLISGSNSSLLLVYHTTSFEFQKILASTYHRESVRCLVKLSNDRFASASLDGAIVLWHATSLTPMRRLHYPERYVDAQNKLICDVAHLLAVDDGRYLAAAIGNGYVVYDVLSGECTVSCPDAHDAQVTHLASLYGGARVLSCSVDGTVKLWAPPSVLSSSSSATSTFFRFTSRLTNNSGAVAAARKAIGGAAKPRLVEPPLRGHCSSVWLALPLDASSVATCSSDGVILLWRDASRESARRALVASQALAQIDGPDDALLASPMSASANDSARAVDSGTSPIKLTAAAAPSSQQQTSVDPVIRVTPPEYLVAFARSRLRKDMVGVEDVVAQLRAEGHAEPLVDSIAQILRSEAL